MNGRKVTERRSPDVFGKLIDKAEAEADWRFSWGLEPPPSGVEVDQLVTVVRFRLNTDGTLDGTPEVLRTNGVTNANRAQVNRHQEQAIRAVRLAAPFNLPEEYYSGWRVITSNFDNRLAQ